jgi:hypothetical protein
MSAAALVVTAQHSTSNNTRLELVLLLLLSSRLLLLLLLRCCCVCLIVVTGLQQAMLDVLTNRTTCSDACIVCSLLYSRSIVITRVATLGAWCVAAAPSDGPNSSMVDSKLPCKAAEVDSQLRYGRCHAFKVRTNFDLGKRQLSSRTYQAVVQAFKRQR